MRPSDSRPLMRIFSLAFNVFCAPTGAFRISIALLYGVVCHVIFTAAVLAMIAGPFHDLRQRPVHEEGPLHYEEKVEIERTSLLQVG